MSISIVMVVLTQRIIFYSQIHYHRLSFENVVINATRGDRNLRVLHMFTMGIGKGLSLQNYTNVPKWAVL